MKSLWTSLTIRLFMRLLIAFIRLVGTMGVILGPMCYFGWQKRPLEMAIALVGGTIAAFFLNLKQLRRKYSLLREEPECLESAVGQELPKLIQNTLISLLVKLVDNLESKLDKKSENLKN